DTDSDTDSDTDLVTYGEPFTGGEYHLGPVDWDETVWVNGCRPYPVEIQALEGNYLAKVSTTLNLNGELCDTCIFISTGQGNSLIARVVGSATNTMNSIDVSETVYDELNAGEWPRVMTWQLVKCQDTGKIQYQYSAGANPWWTAVWVRNSRIPIEKVEVLSDTHTDWYTLTREVDGSYTCDDGFGQGEFTIKVTAIDGQTIEDTFSAFTAGQIAESSGQFE
ncbi:MAG: hypothetical protein JXX29_15050, partial [Deltaproteobacteria bacterium]|nr:hypothetical protein [Deltaproteobacteria bacterium]